MDEGKNRPARGTRAGTLLKVVVLIAVIHLGFAGGIYYSDYFLKSPTPPPPSPPPVTQTQEFNTSQQEIESSIGLRLQKIQEGRWIAEVPVSVSQFVSLTGDSLRDTQSKDNPVGNITKAQATAFCRMLSDAEHAVGVLPRTFRYRLPSVSELEEIDSDTIEWTKTKDAVASEVHTAEIVLAVKTSRYAPDADLAPGGWPDWHANLVSGPQGALSLPRELLPLVKISGRLDGADRFLVIRGVGESSEKAIELVQQVANSIQTTCNAIAKKNREDDLRRFQSMLKTEESRNAEDRTALLDLMSRYEIADSLDLPSWFPPNRALHDDLGIQNTKVNIERLKSFLKLLEGVKAGEVSELPTSPFPPDSATVYQRLLSERKILKVEWEQRKKADPEEKEEATTALRSKVEENNKELAIAKNALKEDTERELKVLEGLLPSLESATPIAKEIPRPSTSQPQREIELETKIETAGQQLDSLQKLDGIPLYDYAVKLSAEKDPLRGLLPEFVKNRNLATELETAIAELEEKKKELEESPLDPEAPEQETDSNSVEKNTEDSPEDNEPGDTNGENSDTNEEPEDPEAAAKAEAEEERLAKLKKERDDKLKELDTAIKQKQELKEKAKNDQEIAEKAVKEEIVKLRDGISKSQEKDRQELEYLVSKRGYLVGWQRLTDLRAKVAANQAILEDTPDPVTLHQEAKATDESPQEGIYLPMLFRDGELIKTKPNYSAPELHFRLVLDKISQ